MGADACDHGIRSAYGATGDGAGDEGVRMAQFLLALICSAAFASLVHAALKGYRGTATSRTDGYGEHLPDHVITDPVRRGRLNRMVFRWCASAALLYLPPLGYLVYVLFDGNREMPLSVLIGLAVYGLIVSSIGRYPFERLKQP